ncbi:MAG: hypothetical protein M1818_004735 [Claussenomyces sp. TS43310]|nr:MAG: hypothetical protein M1818_004735 [Claussenomyces sp. TS43310]
MPATKRTKQKAPPAKHRSAEPELLYRLSLSLQPFLFVAAGYCLWYLGFENGPFKEIERLTHQDVSQYPGTELPLRLSYVGVGPIDRLFSFLVAFFAPVVDGSSPDLALYSIVGLGQLGAGWTLFMMEGLRGGNLGKVVSFVGLYGVLVQNLGFALATPPYLFLHLLTSPIAKPIPLRSSLSDLLLITPHELAILPFSVTLAYVVPALLMIIPAPSIVSYETHQALIAFWQPFPIWTILIFGILKQLAPQASINGIQTASTSPVVAYHEAARRVYKYALLLCLFTHVPVLLITAIPSAWLSSLVPKLATLNGSTILSVFVPAIPLSGHPMTSLANGCHNFLIWDFYIAGAASLLWGIVLYRIAFPHGSLAGLLIRTALWTLISGPFGALAILFWKRDLVLKEKVK